MGHSTHQFDLRLFSMHLWSRIVTDMHAPHVKQWKKSISRPLPEGRSQLCERVRLSMHDESI